MGKAKALVEKNVLLGEVICSAIATDYLIVASVSDWGGYAISLGLCARKYKEAILNKKIENCVNFSDFVK